MIINKYKVLFFLLFTYLLTFTGGTIFFSPQLNETLPGNILIVLKIVFIPSVIAPFFIALLMKYIENKWDGVKELLKLFVNRNTKLFWYILAILLPMLVHLGASLIDSLRGEFFQQPFGYADQNTLFIALQTFFLAGIAEEMGWRGYLQPVLQQKFGSAVISIIIGIVVAVWHLPLFFQENNIHSSTSFMQFILLMVAVAFVYTWLMNNTRSVLILALFHTSHDIASVNFSQADHLSAFALYALIAIIITAYHGPRFFLKKQNQIKVLLMK